MSKSPLTDHQWQFLKRDSKEIKELFFPSTKAKQSNILTLFKEDDCDCPIEIQEFLKDSLVVYYEGNNIPGYQEGNNIPGYQKGEDRLLFYIKIYVSRDGLKIEQAAKECKPDPNEIVFFLEDNTDDYSSQKMYAKFGELATSALRAEMTNKSLVYRKVQAKVPGMTPAMIDELLSKVMWNNLFRSHDYLYKVLRRSFKHLV